MFDRKFILCADGFGLSSENNKAVLEGYVNGFLTCASLSVNTKYFDDAINNVLSDCQDLSVGICLNITRGNALTDVPLLTDESGAFNSGFTYLLKNKSAELLGQIEQEFRAQIERFVTYKKPIHINSLDDIHSIPHIFNITAKLAKEYNIKFIRTHQEELYFIPKLSKHLNIKYFKNFAKFLLLKRFTQINKLTAEKYQLRTNDFIIGVEYEDMMDFNAIEFGLKEISENGIIECVIHPKKYNNSIKDSHTKEFGITLDKNIEEHIMKSGFEVTNYNNL